MTDEQKREKLRELLADSGWVEILVDLRAPGVAAPKRLVLKWGATPAKIHLTLSQGASWPLSCDADGLRAGITYDGGPVVLWLPWAAIVGARRMRL